MIYSPGSCKQYTYDKKQSRMGADLLCGGLDGLLGERDDALDIDAAPLAEVGGEAQHPRDQIPLP